MDKPTHESVSTESIQAEMPRDRVIVAAAQTAVNSLFAIYSHTRTPALRSECGRMIDALSRAYPTTAIGPLALAENGGREVQPAVVV